MTRQRAPAPHGQSLLGDIALAKLGALAHALDLPEREVSRMAQVFEDLSVPWAGWPSGESPPWRSDISDDGTPFEFSAAFDGGEPKLRLLVESQGAEVTPTSTFEAGLALNRRLAEEGKVDLTVFDRIVDLFTPSRAPARFQLWHAAELGPSGCLYKAYLNPQLLGAGAAPDLLHEALDRLGMPNAWEQLAPHLQTAVQHAELRYISVDLKPAQDARVKIYLGRSSADAVEELVRGILPSGQARSWLRELSGFDGPYEARPALTCFSFRPADPNPEVTLHVPVRCYAPNDAEAADRAARFLRPSDADRLTRALRAVAGRPLRSGRGVLTYVSLRAARTGLRVTAYIAPEIYAIGAGRPTLSAPASEQQSERRIRVQPAVPTTLGDIQEVISRRRALIAEHPFLKGLEGEGSLEDVRNFVPRLSFFVMGFQDVLRLARESCVDPDMRAMAQTHEQEDSGHDHWFLSDLKQLQIACGIEDLFSAGHRLARDVVYSLVSEVLRARDDRTRLAVSLSLEAVGAEFFGRVIGFLERMGHDDGLQYFARKHQAVEAAHEVFEDNAQAWLAAIEIPPSAVREVLGAVDTTFEAMTLLADDLALALGVAPRSHSSLPLSALPARSSSVPPSGHAAS